jgi:hypothetical protein
MAVLGLLGLALVARPQPAHAQVQQCTGNRTIQTAPYTCQASKVLDDITFDVTLRVETDGRAVITFVMSPVQAVDMPIAVHSHTGVNGDPRRFVAAVIPAGAQTVTMVMSRVECGQLDIKAVETRSGAAAGRIAGPYVTWGQSCAPVESATTPPPTTGTAPSTSSPPEVIGTGRSTSAPTEATSIVSTPSHRSTLPVTGATVPWVWAATTLILAAILMLVSRLPRRDA